MGLKNKISKGDIIFIVFIFGLSIPFFQNVVLNSTSVLTGGIAGLLSSIVAFLLYYPFKQRNWIVKVIVVLVFAAILISLSLFFGRNSSNISALIIGNWKSKSAGVTVLMNIKTEKLKMHFIPEDSANFTYRSEIRYDYEVNADTLRLHNAEAGKYYNWTVLKADKDSLIVKDNDSEMFKFSREK